jgi:hydrogenase maturation protease
MKSGPSEQATFGLSDRRLVVETPTGGGIAVSPAPILIMGFGNLLRGDDGVGVRVVEELRERRLPGWIELVNGDTEGLDIVNFVEGRQKVILIDTAAIGERAGTFARFSLHDVDLLGEDEHISVHAAGLRDGLLLARALGRLPEDVVVFGVQPASLGWNCDLSAQLEAALPDLIAAVLAEIPTEETEHG